MTWTTNIPAPTDILSVSQGDLQGNNNANQTAFGIDHVTFTLADAGQHNKVTFNANNVPTPPVAPPVLFTNTVAPITTPELFFYSGTQAQSGDQYVLGSLASNKGSVLLMGGIILKWFNGNLTTPTQEFDFAAGPGVVVGLNNFPNGVQGACVTSTSPGGTLTVVGYNALDATKIVVQRNPGTGGSTNVFVVVIGY
jgi:hypothetical protein